VRFRLRDYETADFGRLYEIDQACFPAGISYSRQELIYYMTLRGAFTVVAETSEMKTEIAGFLVSQKQPRGMGHIITIDIVGKFRRHGLGSLLMQDAEDRLKAAGCHAVILEAAVDNAAAIAFYKRLGYFVMKTVPGYYHGNLDALRMAKRIAATSASA
jgi:ribosomal protein S18 acetylase RimI-like enzyme